MNAALKRQFEESQRADEVQASAVKNRMREMGTVHSYEKPKGFGFIFDSDKEKIFVHQSQIISPGYRCLFEGQKVSFVRGENRGKPWAEDVRNPDGTPVDPKGEEEVRELDSAVLVKRRRQQLKEQWRNFFDIPQYALKGHGESLPTTTANQDCFVLGDPVPQLGKVFVCIHGCASTTKKGNECASFLKEKMSKYITKAYEEKSTEKSEVALSLTSAFEMLETEWMERAKRGSNQFTDGAEVVCALFVHALNAAGQPCVQLWIAGTGSCVPLLCSSDGTVVRVMEPHSTKKERAKLKEVGFDVSDTGVAKVAYGDTAGNKISTIYRLPSTRLIGGLPFKTMKATQKKAVGAVPDVKMIKEWRCVAGEELFLLICSAEVLSVLSDQDAMNAALDAWGNPGSGIDGWEAASKAVVRTAQAQGPEQDTLACLAVQFWWQEKPLQRLLARRNDKKKSGVPEKVTKAAEADSFDMFG